MTERREWPACCEDCAAREELIEYLRADLYGVEKDEAKMKYVLLRRETWAAIQTELNASAKALEQLGFEDDARRVRALVGEAQPEAGGED